MGRGLGKLQREILASLEESRDLPRYHGGRNWEEFRPGSGPVAHYRGTEMPLREGVYDLRAVKRVVAKQGPGRTYGIDAYYDTAFSVSFHRAARALVKRGLLVPAFDEPYRRFPKPQLRFVCQPKC